MGFIVKLRIILDKFFTLFKGMDSNTIKNIVIIILVISVVGVGLSTTGSWTGLINASATVSIVCYLQYNASNYTAVVLGDAQIKKMEKLKYLKMLENFQNIQELANR